MIKNYENELDYVNKNVYNVYKKLLPVSKTFVETGCHVGNSLLHAIHGGYTKLYSCDIIEEHVKTAINVISNHCDEYTILHMDSVQFIKQITPTLSEQVTFWLDAHGPSVPTFDELDLIKELSPVNNHNIIIDDIPIYFNHNIIDLINKIKSINNNYIIDFEYIHPHKNNYILTAIIK